MSTDSALTVEVSELSGYALVTAAGSIDFTTNALLHEELGRALALTRLAVIVDLTEVHFCDSSGLNVLAMARRKASARGITVVAAGLQSRVERVFAVTGLDQALYPQPDLQTAINWLETGSRNPGAS